MAIWLWLQGTWTLYTGQVPGYGNVVLVAGYMNTVHKDKFLIMALWFWLQGTWTLYTRTSSWLWQCGSGCRVHVHCTQRQVPGNGVVVLVAGYMNTTQGQVPGNGHEVLVAGYMNTVHKDKFLVMAMWFWLQGTWTLYTRTSSWLWQCGSGCRVHVHCTQGQVPGNGVVVLVAGYMNTTQGQVPGYGNVVLVAGYMNTVHKDKFLVMAIRFWLQGTCILYTKTSSWLWQCGYGCRVHEHCTQGQVPGYGHVVLVAGYMNTVHKDKFLIMAMRFWLPGTWTLYTKTRFWLWQYGSGCRVHEHCTQDKFLVMAMRFWLQGTWTLYTGQVPGNGNVFLVAGYMNTVHKDKFLVMAMWFWLQGTWTLYTKTSSWYWQCGSGCRVHCYCTQDKFLVMAMWFWLQGTWLLYTGQVPGYGHVVLVAGYMNTVHRTSSWLWHCGSGCRVHEHCTQRQVPGNGNVVLVAGYIVTVHRTSSW